MSALPDGQTSSLPQSWLEISRAQALAEAVAAAARLGIWERLGEGAWTLPDLAERCGISLRGARVLLAALEGLGLVATDRQGRYRAALSLPVGFEKVALFWESLTEVIRTGRPAVAGHTPAGAAGFYPQLVLVLGELAAAAAARAAALLAMPGQRILDVGAGAAPWSRALAAIDPAARVLAVDLPAIIPSTRRAVAADGLQGQFSLAAGDLFTLDWGGGFDLAVAANVCHLFAPEANRQLLARLFAALSPGGRVGIIDILADERGSGPLPVTLYELGLLMRTGEGQVYPFSVYVDWLRQAGFACVSRHELGGEPPLTLVSATRPR